uniref:Pentapeptide repeat-containing protein n=1 Tax=Candidatus Kentrum eta TaxID=2126337 RepID=A0A450VH92_9GAMM|nr:MAG: Pentapeptide repeat-containing protein [Candidatus Kentron sp. H]VFK04174.1 MAG: Pentapeptide repeat-containing protein [Candidatus Kentron sp. H]VFK07512.1 MAG: Pentapeptide repeat-containing protein [Candidatus Kentron sp. H]
MQSGVSAVLEIKQMAPAKYKHPKMTTDFSNQDLRGRWFRGRDLRGARFIGADLRGARFRGADLTGADFSGARLGKTVRGVATTVLLSLALGLLAGFLEGFAGFFWAVMIDSVLELIQGTGTTQHGGALMVWSVGGAAGMVAILLFFLWRRQGNRMKSATFACGYV